MALRLMLTRGDRRCYPHPMETTPSVELLERELATVVARFEDAPDALVASVSALAARGFIPPESGREPRIASSIGRLASVEPEKLLRDLDALLVSPTAALALRWLHHVGGLGLLLPEVESLVGFHLSSPRQHKDLWDHTLRVLERLPADADLRWVALAHDIGKVATRALLADGTLAFHRHEAVGARLFLGIGARLGMVAERRARIAFVIEHHARTNQFEPSWTDRALRRLMRECGENLPMMLAFSAADWTTKHRSKAERILGNHALLEARLRAIELEDKAPRVPAGTAEALLKLTGRARGPWIAEAKRELCERFDVSLMGPEDLARAWASERDVKECVGSE
jgi:poly(A) polymerase